MPTSGNNRPLTPLRIGAFFWYQVRRANEIFQALDGKQRGIALLDESRDEDGNETVKA